MSSRTASRPTASPPEPGHLAAAGVLQRHAENPSAFLALNRDTRRFSVPGVDGFLAYRPAGRGSLVQLGGVFAGRDDQQGILEQFTAMALRQRRRIVAVQLLRADAERYAGWGFTVNQLGTSYGRSLSDFDLKGGAHMRLRNKIARARRAGVVVTEVGVDRSPATDIDAQLDAVDAEWLRSKGRHVKELAFMVGERTGPVASLRRLFVATDAGGALLGYITFSPVYGAHAGWLQDLSRRRPQATPGTMELIVVTAVERFRSEGAGYLHFGLTPFTGLSPDDELPVASPVAARLVRLLAEHGRHVYPAADQVAYKQKWAPDLVQPEYVAFADGVSLRSVWALLRLTNAL
ncbi:MAG: phosphatidylglycerol lysyltransferase domain-containing protein [Acidimicrobiales bacterium]